MKTVVAKDVAPDVAEVLQALHDSPIVGDVIPIAWHSNIAPSGDRRHGRKRQLERKNPARRSLQHFLNLHVLAHIVSWYRPSPSHGTDDNEIEVKVLKKKFAGPKLRINRATLAEQLGCNKKQISASLSYLEEIGAIRRTYEPTTDFGEYDGQAVYVLPVMEKITELSRKSDGESLQKQCKQTPEDAQGLQRSTAPGSLGAPFPTPGSTPKTKTTTTTGRSGAAPPASSSSLPSAIKGDCRPPEPPATDSDADAWIKDFKQLYQLIKSNRFGVEGWNPDDEHSARVFHQEYPTWKPLAASAVIVLAWGNIGMEIENRDGTVYRYGACQNSKSLPHCFRHWEKLVNDVNGAGFPATPRKGPLKHQIEVSLAAQFKDDGLTGEDLEDKMCDIQSQLDEIVGLDPVGAGRASSKKTYPAKVPITCDKCGHGFETHDDAISARCPKCNASVPGPVAWRKGAKT